MLSTIDKSLFIILWTVRNLPLLLPLYEGVLKVKENATLSAKAIRPLGDSKVLTEKIDFNKSSMKPIVANQKINEQYMFKGSCYIDRRSERKQ